MQRVLAELSKIERATTRNGDRAAFNRLDTNRDGRLSRDEYIRRPRPSAATSRPRSRPGFSGACERRRKEHGE
jgi:hypothetical protein